ncbi:MAG TPA: helix-turn-helix domain-containing protein [Propionicimonas sp.]|jgi:predicted ArsR family transcriptional regulator|uniref:helix-turn-helix transcriptional regulator n=1 Tax=Propionicimonas sp. TaxID=1955623 RepID=UPI002F42DCF6
MTTEANPRVRGFGPSRAEVLEHLRSTGAAEPVAAIAAAVGLHENTTRFHLDALIEAGMVHREAESRQQPGRPRVLYRADPAPSQSHYQDLAAAMVRHFAGPMEDRGSRAEQAGMAWGAELLAELPADQALVEPEPMPRLIACLARMGYQPELIAGTPPTIALRPCPYSELAGEDPTTVCRLHLGLIRGLIDKADPWEVTALEPYVTPERCVVRFAERADS